MPDESQKFVGVRVLAQSKVCFTWSGAVNFSTFPLIELFVLPEIVLKSTFPYLKQLYRLDWQQYRSSRVASIDANVKAWLDWLLREARALPLSGYQFMDTWLPNTQWMSAVKHACSHVRLCTSKNVRVVVVSIKTPAHRAREISPPTDACQFMGALWLDTTQKTKSCPPCALYVP